MMQLEDVQRLVKETFSLGASAHQQGLEMSLFFFKSWYNESIKPVLSQEEKKALLLKLSELSLRYPLHLPKIEVPKEKLPELVKFSSTPDENFSGLQLYAVMTELFEELYGGLR